MMYSASSVIISFWFHAWNPHNMFQTFGARVLQLLKCLKHSMHECITCNHFIPITMRGIIKGMKRSWMDAFKDLKNKKTYAYVLLNNVNKDCFNAKISCSFHAWTLEHEIFEYMRVLWGEPQKACFEPWVRFYKKHVLTHECGFINYQKACFDPWVWFYKLSKSMFWPMSAVL